MQKKMIKCFFKKNHILFCVLMFLTHLIYGLQSQAIISTNHVAVSTKQVKGNNKFIKVVKEDNNDQPRMNLQLCSVYNDVTKPQCRNLGPKQWYSQTVVDNMLPQSKHRSDPYVGPSISVALGMSYVSLIMYAMIMAVHGPIVIAVLSGGSILILSGAIILTSELFIRSVSDIYKIHVNNWAPIKYYLNTNSEDPLINSWRASDVQGISNFIDLVFNLEDFLTKVSANDYSYDSCDDGSCWPGL